MAVKIIGIVGGVGPYAGLDLNRKIFDNTSTDGTDQDHLETLLFSAGRRVPDRTEYLLGRSVENPTQGLFEALSALAAAGGTVAAIACNTAHAETIIGPLKSKILEVDLGIELLDMIEETGRFIRECFGAGKAAGLLATEGTVRTGVYKRLAGAGGAVNKLLTPDDKVLAGVHRAIYDTSYGIKARSNPVTERVVESCRTGVRHLASRGADFVILGCTELPLALTEPSFEGIPLLDPTSITARALIRRVAPEKLRPLR